MGEIDRILNKFEGRVTKPLTISDLELILTRYKYMLTDENILELNPIEFIEQEDYRKNLFTDK